MHSFNVYFAQAQIHNDNRLELQAGFIESLHIKTPIRVRIPIPKDRLASLRQLPKCNQGPGIRRNNSHLIPPCGS